MAFLQAKYNLGDLRNKCEAQNNLGLLSMAYQCSSNVHIYEGDIQVSSLRLKGEGIERNFVLMASNEFGDAEWKNLAVADWLQVPPSQILLSSLCNDQQFVQSNEIFDFITDYIVRERDTIVNPQLSLDTLTTTDITLTSFDSSITSQPCAMTNNGYGSNIIFSPLDQLIVNNSNTIPSSKAVFDLSNIVSGIGARLPSQEGAEFMISTNNFNESNLNKTLAISNLGLNEYFHTKVLTVKDVHFEEPSYFEGISTKNYFDPDNSTQSFRLVKAPNNKLDYKLEKLIHSHLNADTLFPASASNVNTLYLHLDSNINNKLEISNVLSEIILDHNGCNNPYRAIFKDRLVTTGVQEVAFTSNYYHLGNRPIQLSAFSNEETLFIRSRCNLSDIHDNIEALSNLGISRVGITGNFEDLILPLSISKIFSYTDSNGCNLGDIPGVPFFITTNFFSEIEAFNSVARKNLGIGDLATFDQNNVLITDGNITVSNCIIREDLVYINNNVDIAYSGQNGVDIFLKCYDEYGKAVWENLPEANPDNNTRGVVYITNDLTISDSNTAISVWSLSNIFFNNDAITNLVPISTFQRFGIVQLQQDYTVPSVREYFVINANGVNRMYNELNNSTSNLKDYVDDLTNTNTSTMTTLINSKMSNLSILNHVNYDFLNLTKINNTNDNNFQLSLNFPGQNNQYLSGDGSFNYIVPTTIQKEGTVFSNQIVFAGDNDTVEFESNNVIRFKNTIYTVSGAGLTLNNLSRNIVNTGLVSYDGSVFDSDNVSVTDTGKRLKLTGSIVGNTSGKLIGTSNTYLKCITSDSYAFSAIDLESLEIEKHAVTSLKTNSESTNVFEVTGSGGRIGYEQVGQVEVNLKGGDSNEVITKNEYGNYVWRKPYELLVDSITTPLPANLADYDNSFLNANGNFTIPASARDFTVSLEIDTGGILKTTQTLNSTIPNGIQNASVTITHRNINGLYDYYIEKNRDVIYHDATGYIKKIENPAGTITSTNIPHASKDVVDDNLDSYRDNLVTFSGLQKYTNLSLVDFHETNVAIDTVNFNDGNLEKIATGSNVYEYIHTHNALPFERSYDNATLENKKLIFRGGNVDKYFRDNRYSSTSNSDSLSLTNDIKFITPKAVKTYLENNYIQNTAKIFGSAGTTEKVVLNNPDVVTGDGLYRYINNNMVFDSNVSLNRSDHDNKLIRGKNLVRYLDDNKFTLGFPGEARNTSSSSFDNNVYYITPYTLKQYTNDNYINLTEKIMTSDTPGKIISTNMDVVTGQALHKYINTDMVFRSDASLTATYNEYLIKGKNLIKHFDDNRYTSDEEPTLTLSNDIQFITPKAVKTYLVNNYINLTEKITIIDTPGKIISTNTDVVTGQALDKYINIDMVFTNKIDSSTYHDKLLVRGKNLVEYLDDNKFKLNITNTVNINPTFDNNVHYITPYTLKQYTENNYINLTEKIMEGMMSKIVLTNTNVVTGQALYKYINTDMVFDCNVSLNLGDHKDKLIRGKNLVKHFNDNRYTSSSEITLTLTNDILFITPYAVKTYLVNNYINLTEKITITDTPGKIIDTNTNVVTGQALYKYINTDMVFTNKIDSSTYHDKLLVRGKNLVEYYSDNKASIFSTSTTEDIKYTTPSKVHNYTSINYINLTEKIMTSDTPGKIIDTNMDVVTGQALYKYINTDMVFNGYVPVENTLNDNHLLRGANLKAHLANFKFDSSRANMDDDVSYITPLGVNKYLNSNYLHKNNEVIHYGDTLNFDLDITLSSLNNLSTKVVSGGALHNYINVTASLPNDANAGVIILSINENKIVKAINLVNYLKNNIITFTTTDSKYTSLSVDSFDLINSSFDNKLLDTSALKRLIFNDNGLIIKSTLSVSTPFVENRVLSSLATQTYLRAFYLQIGNIVSKPEDVDIDTTNPITRFLGVNRTTPNNVYNVSGLSNLIFHDSMGLIIPSTLSASTPFVENRVLSSQATKTYLEAKYVKQDDTYQMSPPPTPGLPFFVNSSLFLEDEDGTGGFIGGFNDYGNSFFPSCFAVGSFVQDYIKGISVSKKVNSSAHLIFLPDYESDPVSELKFTDIITVSGLKGVLNEYYEKVDTRTVTPLSNIVYTLNTANIQEEQNIIPTIGLIESMYTLSQAYTDARIYEESMSTTLTFTNLTLETLEVKQSIRLLTSRTDRDDSVGLYMTIDSEGYLDYSPINELPYNPNNSNLFTNSTVIGETLTTFNSNQLLCGQYNSKSNIYEEIGYHERALSAILAPVQIPSATPPVYISTPPSPPLLDDGLIFDVNFNGSSLRSADSYHVFVPNNSITINDGFVSLLPNDYLEIDVLPGSLKSVEDQSWIVQFNSHTSGDPNVPKMVLTTSPIDVMETYLTGFQLVADNVEISATFYKATGVVLVSATKEVPITVDLSIGIHQVIVTYTKLTKTLYLYFDNEAPITIVADSTEDIFYHTDATLIVNKSATFTPPDRVDYYRIANYDRVLSQGEVFTIFNQIELMLDFNFNGQSVVDDVLELTLSGDSFTPHDGFIKIGTDTHMEVAYTLDSNKSHSWVIQFRTLTSTREAGVYEFIVTTNPSTITSETDLGGIQIFILDGNVHVNYYDDTNNIIVSIEYQIPVDVDLSIRIHQIVVTFDTDTLQLYFDDEFVETVTVPAGSTVFLGNTIVLNKLASFYAHEAIEYHKLAIYNKILSSMEVFTIFNPTGLTTDFNFYDDSNLNDDVLRLTLGGDNFTVYDGFVEIAKNSYMEVDALPHYILNPNKSHSWVIQFRTLSVSNSSIKFIVTTTPASTFIEEFTGVVIYSVYNLIIVNYYKSPGVILVSINYEIPDIVNLSEEIHQVIVTFDRVTNTLKLYLNEDLVGTKTASSASDPVFYQTGSTIVLNKIGSFYSNEGTQFYRIATYNRVLSQAEVKTISIEKVIPRLVLPSTPPPSPPPPIYLPSEPNNKVLLCVGMGSDIGDPKNGFEVHDTGEVFVRSNLILGENWRLSFDNDSLSIEKYDLVNNIYIQKHIFR
jgi:hypothetical protein